MLVKSPVIVLGSVKYGDSSVILKTYSREFGLISFIAGGVRGKKGGLKSAIMLPLNQMEAVFYDKSKSSLRRLKEVSSPKVYQNMYYDPVKNCMCMFLAEVLSHVLHEEEPQAQLYDFLSHSFYLLDDTQTGVANFHLSFLYELSAFLGFQPESYSKGQHFDMLNGVYTIAEPPHSYYLTGENLEHWRQLATLSTEGLDTLKLNGDSRAKLLQYLIDYYRLHLKDFGDLKSLDVLHTILR